LKLRISAEGPKDSYGACWHSHPFGALEELSNQLNQKHPKLIRRGGLKADN
jgi:hypothetical protein